MQNTNISLSEQKSKWLHSIEDLAKKIEMLANEIRESDEKLDARWVSIGLTDLEKGFMGLVRGITS